MYIDQWQIANVANLGANFTLESGTNQRIVTQATVGNATGATAAWYRYNVGKMASDNMRIDCWFITPTAGSLNTGISGFLYARMPNTFATGGAAGSYIACSLTSAGAWTLQSINQTTFTSQASGNIGTITLPGKLSLIACGTFYQVLWNDAPISGASWTDTSNTVISIGATKRNFGLLIQCAATNSHHASYDFLAAHDLAGQTF